MRIAVAYANIQNGGRDSLPKDVEHDAELTSQFMTRRFARRADWLAFNEIQEHDDKDRVLLGVGKRYDRAHLGTPNPQFWLRNRFVCTYRKHYELSPVWPGNNPARYLCRTTLSTRVSWGPEVEFLNVHMTNGAFNKEHLDTQDERRVRWHREDKGVGAIVRSLTLPAVIVGDFNKVQVSRYNKDMHWIHTNGIIKMAVIPSVTWDIDVLDAEQQIIRSDKPALGAILEFNRRK
jgi:hypothetical protein